MMRRILALVAMIGLFSAPTAAADTVPQTFLCAYPGMSHWFPRDMVVTIDAPATVTRGVPTPVYLRLADTTAITTDRPATTNYTLRIGFSTGGSIDVGGLANQGIPAGTPWMVERTADLTFTTSGSTTLTATFHHFGSTPVNSACRAGETVPAAEIVNVVG